MLRLARDHDISGEGGRISSAQRKILSLCFFFAEILSEVKNPSELTNYVLVFDDPVDSADYHHFHSIAALLEHMETILSKILKKEIKLGQIIVTTHNSLLFDRLSQSFQFRRTLSKRGNTTQATASDKTVNNYKTYLEYIVSYHKNPQANRKDMIFIGNIIRRTLEIVSNFNNLGSNNFRNHVIDIGKPKLALLANHLSHESFTKVLNPFASELELQAACGELLEVIKQSHPEQYK
uniref:Protein CR006 P-loop domain-containing protein n=1 Tax=Chlorobium phaeobacteroides (strain BS1) TaxID=331678 RepID=B3EJU5_CHLPB